MDGLRNFVYEIVLRRDVLCRTPLLLLLLLRILQVLQMLRGTACDLSRAPLVAELY